MTYLAQTFISKQVDYNLNKKAFIHHKSKETLDLGVESIDFCV